MDGAARGARGARPEEGAEGRTISHNTLIHRGVRRLVGPLSRLGVRPNHVTAARLATGLAGSALYGIGAASGGPAVAGSVLVLVSLALDRIDGELARSTGQMSAFGHKFDLAADAVTNAAVFLGLGLGLSHGVLGGWSLPLGLLAAAGILGVLALVVHLERRHGARAGEAPSGGAFDPDDAMVVVPVGVLLGGAVPVLLAAALGAPLAAAVLCWHFRGKLAAPFEGAEGAGHGDPAGPRPP